MDRTQIFRLYFQIFGKIDRVNICHFIDLYAPNKRVFLSSYSLAYCREKGEHREDQDRKSWQFTKDNIYQIAVKKFKEYAQDPKSPYTKRPMMGQTHLYFASPVYRFRDYNKWEVMPIKGNERFCETICKLADKYFE